jgi:hypothetical protein
MTAPTTQSRTRHWSRKRVKAVGFGAIIAGTVFTVLSVLSVVFLESPALTVYTRLVLPIVSAGMYGLLAVATLGAYTRYTARIGRLSRAAILILCAALTMLGLSLLVRTGLAVLIGLGTVGETETVYAFLGIINDITTTVLIILFVCASIVGVIFWRISEASRLTASLFMLAGPAFFASYLLELLPIVTSVRYPLYLGFVALGATLWRDSRTSSPE